MAHKTMVGGTFYEISGGKTLVNGTAFSIKNGKTFVDGTTYEVGFAPAEATVTITGYGSKSTCYIVVGGITYTSPATLLVPIGTVIVCHGYTEWGKGGHYPELRLNGTLVSRWSESGGAYDYTVAGNATINLTQQKYYDDDDDAYYVGKIAITET